MKFVSAFVLAVFLMIPAGMTQAANITVSAAASLTNAMDEIKTAFEKARADVKVATNYAASNPLLQQIREGAPVDVFATADQDTMNRAQTENLIDPATRRDFVANTLVLIVPLDGKAVQGVADLGAAKRIAIGNPDSVPAGRYARTALQSINQWDALSPKFVQGESVRQVLDYVARGEVDAGFVYATDAFIAKDTVRIVATMSGHDPILYPVAVSASSREKAAAQAFVDYLFSGDGTRILESFGFTTVK